VRPEHVLLVPVLLVESRVEEPVGRRLRVHAQTRPHLAVRKLSESHIWECTTHRNL
jgi:hypothetical protein